METRGCGRSQGLWKIFRAAIYRAHRAVVFAIAQFSCCYRRRQKKGKGRKGKERKGKVHKVTSTLYFTNMGSRPLGPISTKIGKVVGVHDVSNPSQFGFKILRCFRSTGGQNFRFPIDFAGHRYNSAVHDQ